ncbi:MAG TPA: hypothetical protein VMB75_05585 [Rhodocyclaceae bacterium]|nr:hypothetical protein [Rhodocyclaceae bacterium]
MFRALRIAVLLVILATVAQAAWLARARTTSWKDTVHAVIYPVNGDGSPASAGYIAQLGSDNFRPIERFLAEEAQRYALPLKQPVEISLAPPVASLPPQPPAGGNALQAIAWSLQMRWWAWHNDSYRGRRPDVRLFVLFFDPAKYQTLPHSVGLEKGQIGVINAFAGGGMGGSNNVIIAHEMLHTFGATDKYDPATNYPRFPEGFAEPERQPRLPQDYAEIMAGRTPVSETAAETPRSLAETVIGPATAAEINWRK